LFIQENVHLFVRTSEENLVTCGNTSRP